VSGGFRPEMVESPSRRGHVEGARTRAVAQVSVTGCTPHRERIDGRDAYCSGVSERHDRGFVPGRAVSKPSKAAPPPISVRRCASRVWSVPWLVVGSLHSGNRAGSGSV
jgi:hypothetical protein